MQILYYEISFLIIIALSCVYVYRWRKHFELNITMIFMLISLVGLGYNFMYQSADLSFVITGIKIIYVGGCYLPFFITMCIFDFCHVEVGKLIRLLCFIGSTVTYIGVLSVGYNPMFYKTITALDQGGVVIIEKEYGFWHTVFYAVLALYFVSAMIVLIHTFFTKKQISRVILVLLGIPDFFSVIGYVFNHFMKDGYEIMPITYIFAMVIYLFIVHRMSFYNVGVMAVESMAQSGDTAFVTLDLKKRYLGSNQSARRIFTSLNSYRLDQTMDDDDELRCSILAWIDAFEADKANNKNIYNIDEKTYVASVDYLYDDKKIMGYQLSITDDTKNQEYIKLLDKYNLQLKQKAELAVAADKAKGRFLAQMSHEIRTPMNAVLGMNEMILQKASDDSIIEYASDIDEAGRSLLSIINSILDFSKLEDGKMELVPVEYELSAMITNLVKSVSKRAKDKGLELIVNVDEKLPVKLYGDDMRISQVISNLLTNAIKYTKEGKVEFDIKMISSDEENVDILVKVTDTGIGIKKEDLPRLFESFERLDEEKNRAIEGTGLGMAIVTMLLDMMGSKLNVESEYGQGSAFSFILRQKVIDAVPIGAYTKKSSRPYGHKKENKPIAIQGAKVLVVDDNKMNLKVANHMLKLTGIEPDIAMSGFEAIELIKENKYHIVFLDHMMPKMDGIMTLAKLKEMSLVNEDMAMIALTANAIAGVREQYLTAGFNDYISKPIELKKLEDILLKYIPAELIVKGRAD